MVAVEELLGNPAIETYLVRMIRDEGVLLLRKFPEEGEHSDEELAETTGINLNSVRHTLYTLYEKRLAEYRRIKNSETGWLTYLWKLRLDNIEDALYEDMEAVLEMLEAREKYEEENDFYVCKQCGIIFTFDDALGREFTCPQCDERMEHFDNDLILRALKRRVEAIRATLGKA
ncbi:MAG: transcription factor [Methanomicrobiaceae archaeon]|nr:transcription factor [Methanomicrobiaceae archaeon]